MLWSSRLKLYREGLEAMHICEVIENASLPAFSMIVSRRGCLQAVGNECEFVGHEREQNGRFVGNESERTNAMFASRGAYVCKLLQIRVNRLPQHNAPSGHGLATC
jgi:hypothetical protein